MPPLRGQTPGAEALRAPRALAKRASAPPDSCPHSERAGGTAAGRLRAPRGARGEGRGRGTQRGSRARRAATHPRTRRSRTGWSCWTLPSPRAPRAAAGSAPEPPQPPRPPAHGQVPGRAAGTSLWTLPALPAPPDDALPPPLFMCGFRPPGRLRTLLSASLRASGVGASAGGARGGRSAAIEAPAEPPCGERSHARRGALAARRLPAPSPGRPPSQRHFERPGRRRRETDRQSDLPLLPPPQLRSRAHKGRRGDAGARGLVRLPRA